jgi:phosphoglycolate phosphatase
VDDLSAVWRATNYVMRQAGISEFSLEQFRAEFCLPFSSFYARYVSHISMPQLEEWFHTRFREVQNSIVELPHAGDFLRFCREQGLRTFLLSTVHQEHFASQCAKNGFDRLFEQAYLGVWDKRAKILELLQENLLRSKETLFVGDMQHDIDTAKHGGVFSCAVLTGYNRLEQLRRSQPDFIVEHLGELRHILERRCFELQSASAPGAANEAAQPTVTVGALIFNQRGEVLMIRTHKWSDLWGIPGGKIKYGEAALTALDREIKEETNLDVENVEFVLVQDCIHSTEFYREAHFVLLNYICCCRGSPDVRLNSEAQEFQWLSFQDALGLDLNQPTRTLLSRVKDRPRPDASGSNSLVSNPMQSISGGTSNEPRQNQH